MAARTWTLALLVATATLLAGCTSNGPASDKGNDGPAPPADQPPAQTPDRAPPRAAERPNDFTLTDAGEIQGPFSQTWTIQVANVAFNAAGLTFSLESLQAGAPPTALIHLTLYDPNGAPLQQGTVGLGAPSNELTWTFSPGQLPLAGTYELKAESAPQGGLPSAGFAAYSLDAHVRY